MYSIIERNDLFQLNLSIEGQSAVQPLASLIKRRVSISKEDHLYRIMDITESVTASAGDNAEFFCMVDANPMTADTVKWTRQGDGFDMEARDDGLPHSFLPLNKMT